MTKDHIEEAFSTERALDLALEALEVANSLIDSYYLPKEKAWLPEIEEAITAIKQARSAPVQEPVAWMWNGMHGQCVALEPWLPNKIGIKATPLYTTPPAAQRQWVGLTDEEIVSINDQHYNIAFRDFDADVAIARAIEAKLKEKNQ